MKQERWAVAEPGYLLLTPISSCSQEKLSHVPWPPLQLGVALGLHSSHKRGRQRCAGCPQDQPTGPCPLPSSMDTMRTLVPKRPTQRGHSGVWLQ